MVVLVVMDRCFAKSVDSQLEMFAENLLWSENFDMSIDKEEVGFAAHPKLHRAIERRPVHGRVGIALDGIVAQRPPTGVASTGWILLPNQWGVA